MKVWFSIVPGHGHFYPLIPLARALAAAGHEVTFCTSRAYADVVERHGFATVAVGPDYTQSSAKGEATSPEDVNRIVATKMFVESPPLVLADLLARFAEGPPDVMVLDPWERAGFVAAEAANVPFGAVILGVRTGVFLGQLPFDLDERSRLYEEKVRGPDERLRAAAGLEPHRRWLGEGPYDRTLALDMAPPSLRAWPDSWSSHTSHPLRPEVHVSGGDHSWLAALDPERPTVAVSFGTLFGTQELYESVVEASLGTGAQVVAITDFELDVEHDGLVTVAWASLDELLKRTDAVVHHGGWGTTVAALVSGTPSITLPLGSDQPVNATRLQAAGAGLNVSPARVADELGPALERVLTQRLFRANAARLQAEIAAMPGAAEVVPLVERLATEGGPVLNR